MQAFQERCRQEKIPFTVQRRTTFEVLLARSDHPTADHVHDAVHAVLPDVSRMTVYRVLELLVRFGLVRKVCHPGTAARFDPNLRQHHHLICLQCGTMVDFEETALNVITVPPAASRLGFEVSDYFVQFRGICAACRCKKAPGKADRSKAQGKRGA